MGNWKHLRNKHNALKHAFKHGQWKVYAGDVVQVLSGKQQGKQGRVLQVIKNKVTPEVIVEGVNIRVKEVDEGGFKYKIHTEHPIPYSMVGVVDPITQRPVTIVFSRGPDGKRLRYGKGPYASDQPIPKPVLAFPQRVFSVGPKDTPREEVEKVTYDPSKDFPFLLNRRPSRSTLGEFSPGYRISEVAVRRQNEKWRLTQSARGFAASALSQSGC